MIPEVGWYKPVDTVILMFLSEHRWRIIAPPATVSMNVGVSSGHVNRRLKILEDAGMVEQMEKQGYYRITDFGERVIMGVATAEEVEAADPNTS